MGGSGTKALSNLRQLAHLLDLSLTLLGLEALDGVLEESLVCGEAGVLGNAVVVLAGEQAAGERRPDGGAVAMLLEEGSILVLEALAVEGVVLGLLDDGGDQVVLLGEVDGLLDLDGAPLRGTPVVGKVEVADNLGEGLDDFEHGGGGVGTVGEDNIDVRGLETLDGGLETLDDVLAAETAGVGLLATGTEEDLSGQDVLVTGPAELLEGLAHLDFGSTVGINLGSVEGLLLKMLLVLCFLWTGGRKKTYNAMVPGSLEALLDDLALLGTTVGEPATEGEDGNLETGVTQVTELHVLGLIGRGNDGRIGRHGGCLSGWCCGIETR